MTAEGKQETAGLLAKKGVVPQEVHYSREIFDVFFDYLCREEPIYLKALIEHIERNIICKVLLRARGNQKEAARILGIKYTTLNEKIKKYGIRFQKSPLS